jgi:hypothetical protein
VGWSAQLCLAPLWPIWNKLELASSRYLSVLAAINGHQLTAIIDTGATRTVISTEFASKLRLPISGSLLTNGLTQQVRGNLYRISRLEVSGLILEDTDILGLDLSAMEGSVSREISLFVGQDLIAKGLLEVEFPNDRARLVTSLDVRTQGSYAKLPISIGQSNLPFSSVELENRQKSQAIIDLGSNVMCSISKDFASSSGLLENKPSSTTMTVGVEGPTIGTLFSIRRLSLGPFVFNNVPACAISDWRFSHPIDLGWPIFSAFDFVLDLGHTSLWLKADSSLLRLPLPRDRSGIGASRLADRLVVRHVGNNSPAELAGLQDGDEIVAINGRPVTADYPSRNERQGEQPAGTSLSLTLATGRTLTLVLADYF